MRHIAVLIFVMTSLQQLLLQANAQGQVSCENTRTAFGDAAGTVFSSLRPLGEFHKLQLEGCAVHIILQGFGMCEKGLLTESLC